ncbi:hypothetical protein COOONC_27950 [Cooperia oncophora]
MYLESTSVTPVISEYSSSCSRNMLTTTSRNTELDSVRKDFSQQQMNSMKADDLVEMLLETTVLEEQASIVHCLWMNQ